MAKEKQEHEAYTKQQFISSRKYSAAKKDLLNALLEEGKTYTHEQVESAIKKYLEQEAK